MFMSSMLPPSTLQHGVYWPTIATAADQAVYLKWKFLFVSVYVGNLLFTLCPCDPTRIFIR
jgi:hypothetical protein